MIPTKKRVLTMAALLLLSIAGGLIGHKLNSSVGFTAGMLITYFSLTMALIVTGKVAWHRKKRN